MRRRNITVFFMGMMILLTANYTSASMFHVGGSSTGTQYLDANNPISGSFDINGALDMTQFTVTSAAANFFFSDNNDSPSYSYSTGTDYSFYALQSGPYGPQNTYLRGAYDHFVNPIETSEVTIRDDSLNGTSNYYHNDPIHRSTTVNGWHFDTNPISYFETYNYTVEEGYHGSWTVHINLDSASLNDLQVDGKLDYNVFAQLGNMNLDSSLLGFDVIRNPVQTTEPATMLLLGLSLTGVACVRRKFKV